MSQRVLEQVVDYGHMLGIRKLRLFERWTESDPVDCVAKDDGHALTNEEVDRIARSLIDETPPDDSQQREAAVDSAPQGDGCGRPEIH